MADLKRWYTLREEAMRARREVTTAAQLERSSVPVTVDPEQPPVDVPVPDLMQTIVETAQDSAWLKELTATLKAAQERLDQAQTELENAQTDLNTKVGENTENIEGANERLAEAEARVSAAEQGVVDAMQWIGTTAQAALEARQAADAVAGRAVEISRTVDGLNRIYAGRTAPGRGYVGYDNLAPAVRGSGTWATVWRNLWKGSQLSVNRASLGHGGNSSSMQTGEGLQVEVLTQPASAISYLYTAGTYRVPVIPGRAYSWRIPVRNVGTVPFPVQVYTWIEGNTSAEGSVRTVKVTLAPGEERDILVEGFLAGAAAVDIRWSLYYNAGDPMPPVGAKLMVLDGISLVEGVRAAPRGSGEQVGDPDMRGRWVGTAAASESEFQIETPVGLAAVTNVIAGVSTRDGLPAIRLINTLAPGQSAYAFVRYSVPTVARSGGVFEATRHQVAPVNAGAGLQPRAMIVQAPVVQSLHPNQLGASKHRLSFGALSTPWSGYLYHGGSHGDPDVWYTGIGLYAGSLPATAQLLHNGDLWYELDESGGISSIRIWDGQDWQPYQIVADSVLAAQSVTAPLIRAGTVQALVAEISEAFIRDGHIQDLDVGKLVVTGRADLSEAVVQEFWARIATLEELRVTVEALVEDLVVNGLLSFRQAVGLTLEAGSISGAIIRAAQLIGSEWELEATDAWSVAYTGGAVTSTTVADFRGGSPTSLVPATLTSGAAVVSAPAGKIVAFWHNNNRVPAESSAARRVKLDITASHATTGVHLMVNAVRSVAVGSLAAGQTRTVEIQLAAGEALKWVHVGGTLAAAGTLSIRNVVVETAELAGAKLSIKNVDGVPGLRVHRADGTEALSVTPQGVRAQNLPFAMAAGEVNVPHPANTANITGVVVTLPPGRFTQPPLPTANLFSGAGGSQKDVARAYASTVSSITLGIWTGDQSAANAAHTDKISWTAVQMTEGNSTG